MRAVRRPPGASDGALDAGRPVTQEVRPGTAPASAGTLATRSRGPHAAPYRGAGNSACTSCSTALCTGSPAVPEPASTYQPK